MRMWGIPLKCTACNGMMSHSGIYTKAREVIDFQSRYYLIGGDYPRCRKCSALVCPWHGDLLKQLDPSHRELFPAVLSTRLALDRSCVTLMKPRTLGNSSSYAHQVLEETHSQDEVKGVITSTYGRILKLDSTKKVHRMLTYQTYICIELWVYGYVSFIHH